MRLIVTRHGETEFNVQERLQGQMNVELTQLGEEQAKKVALRLKDEKIDVIYSSDLKRAADTAKEIHKYHGTVPIHYVKELREKDLGVNNGKKISEIDWSQIEKDPLNAKFEDGESINEIFNRVKLFLDEILHKHKKDNVLFVVHNGSLSCLLCDIYEGKPDKFLDYINNKNTSINIFEIDEDKNHKVILLNCVKHLE